MEKVGKIVFQLVMEISEILFIVQALLNLFHL